MLFESREFLSNGQVIPEKLPISGGKRWGCSLVIRPSDEVISNALPIIEELKAATGSNHLFYDKESLHCTIRSFEGHREIKDANDPWVASYQKTISSILKNLPPIGLLFKGITATRSGVFAQGWPQNDSLQKIRETLFKTPFADAPIEGPEINSVRNTAHMSLLLFASETLKDPKGFLRIIDFNRHTQFGTAVPYELDLVSYQLTESKISVRTLTRFEDGKN